MSNTNLKSDNTLDLASCVQVQDILHSLDIPCAIYAQDGTRIKEAILHEDNSCLCCHWQECQARFFKYLRDQSENICQEEFSCMLGHQVLVVPVRRKKNIKAYLFCCLCSLQYKKTEALERICSRLSIDCSFLVEQGLANTFSSHEVGSALNQILQQLLKKTQNCRETQNELEAVSDSLSKSYEELALLHNLSDKMRVTQNPKTFFAQLCQDLKDVLEVEKVIIYWSDGQGSISGFPELVSTGEDFLDHMDIQMIWRRTENLPTNSNGVLLDSNVDGPYQYNWPPQIRNIASVPIRRDKKHLGALVSLNKQNKPDFSSIETKLMLSIANETAVYLENSRLFNDLQDLLMGSLRALTNSIDAKDPYTCGHSERVAQIARYLACKVDLPTSQVNNIYFAGLLHDIGKIGVSESVLCKPGRLTDREYEQIKKHPQIGANILRGIKQMTEVARAVLNHHENFDGSGYPRGISSRSIPLAGRIVRLADSIDAMINERTYRRALPPLMVFAEIRRFSGTQFDPQLAEILLNSDIRDFLNNIESNNAASHSLDDISVPL